MKQVNNRNLIFTKELQTVFDTIHSAKGECRLVGGCVRDHLLGKTPKDFDIATDILPEEIFEEFKNKKHKTVPVGIEHGTVLVVINQESFEITTLREDIKCFGRHADVKFTKNWEIDASRRDFTINGIYMDMSGVIYDYHNGISDLKNKIVKFIGDPESRIQEDYLRILRYFRFLSYFGTDNIDQQSYLAAIKNASKLVHISKERIKCEIFKLFTGEYFKDVILLLIKLNLLKYFGIISLSLSENKLQNINFQRDNIINLAIFIILSDSPNLECLNKLKKDILLSKKEFIMLKNIINYDYENITYQDFYQHYHDCGEESYKKFLLLHKIIKNDDDIKIIKESICKKFPVKGNDLKNIGYEGRDIGIMLKKAKSEWHQKHNSLNKEDILKNIPPVSRNNL
ncbi:MAG: poly(A) polymerase [Candidatus Midichloriaceae bacterium]|jgi:poly(A) polymerase